MQEVNNAVVPVGYRKNAAGHLVPESKVETIDKLRDELVTELTKEAQQINQKLVDFRLKAVGRIAEFIELSANEYDVNVGGKKGNVSLTSYDGSLMIKRAMHENIAFDERIQVAKQIIDDCIHRWSEGSDDNIKALVDHAFQTDKEGNISVTRILGLRRLDIKDEQWLKGMEAIADSINITGSKVYLRFYQRPNDDSKLQQLPLDIAKA